MKGDAIASELIRSSSDLSDFYDMSSIVGLRSYREEKKYNALTGFTQRELDHVGYWLDQVYTVHPHRDDNMSHQTDQRLQIRNYNN